MASSFISFKDKGFWASDCFVESFQLLLFEEISLQYQDDIQWLNNYKKDLALQSLPLIYGGMSMCFDETLKDGNRAAIILRLIDDIKKKIINYDEYLTGAHLNLLRKNVRHFLVDIKEFEWDEEEIDKLLEDGNYGELPVEKYQRGFSLLRALVAGQLNFKADTEITYWGD